MYDQKINNGFSKQIAECVGLWLAEGDNKCNNERPHIIQKSRGVYPLL